MTKVKEIDARITAFFEACADRLIRVLFGARNARLG